MCFGLSIFLNKLSAKVQVTNHARSPLNVHKATSVILRFDAYFSAAAIIEPTVNHITAPRGFSTVIATARTRLRVAAALSHSADTPTDFDRHNPNAASPVRIVPRHIVAGDQ